MPSQISWPSDRGATKGDADSGILYAAVGYALSNWEELEDEFAKLFCVLVGARWGEPAARAYGVVSSSYTRIDMQIEAADAFFHFATFRKRATGPDQAIVIAKNDFEDLMKQCRKFAARRNEIAHGRCRSHPDLGHFLKPADYNSRKTDFDEPFGSYSYTSVEIKIYADEFARLTQRCIALRSTLDSIAKKIS
jgi:hypothetical protein